MFALLFALLAVYNVRALPSNCLQSRENVGASLPDNATRIFAGASISAAVNINMLATVNYLYTVERIPSGGLSMTQSSWGGLGSDGGVVIGSLMGQAVAMVVPDVDPNNLHFLVPNGSGVKQLSKPVPLPAPGPFTTAAEARDGLLIQVSSAFYASATTIVRVCFHPIAPGKVIGTSSLDLNTVASNKANVDMAVESGFLHTGGVTSTGGVVFVSRRNSKTDIGDIITLVTDQRCGMKFYAQTYVAPYPVGLSVARSTTQSLLFWQMNGGSGGPGRFYESNLLGYVSNASVALDQNERFSRMGFAEPRTTFFPFGMLASGTPGAAAWTARLYQTRSFNSKTQASPPHLYCEQQLSGSIPLVSAQPTYDSSGLLLATNSDDYMGVSWVTLKVPTLADVLVPDALPPLPRVFEEQRRKRDVEGTCPAVSFGYPPTCSGCTPPQAVCGITLECDSGCCFVHQGQVACCSSAPPAFGPSFVC